MSRVSLSYAVISDQDRRHHQRCCFTSLENGKPVIYCLLWVRSLLLQIKHSLLSVFISSIRCHQLVCWPLLCGWSEDCSLGWEWQHCMHEKLWESWLMLSALNTAVFQKDLIFLHLFCLCVRNSMRHLFTVGGAARFTSRADSIIDSNGLCLLLPRHRR